MLEFNGLLAIALKRTHIEKGYQYKNKKRQDINNKWLTSPYCQIEPAMAFQLGLPILILRDKSVISDGILRKDIIGNFMSVFDIQDGCNYLKKKDF